MQVGSSGMQTWMLLSVGVCIRGAPWYSTLVNEMGRNGVRIQREKSSWNTGQATLPDPVGVRSEDGPSGYPDMSTGQGFIPLPAQDIA